MSCQFNRHILKESQTNCPKKAEKAKSPIDLEHVDRKNSYWINPTKAMKNPMCIAESNKKLPTELHHMIESQFYS